MTVSIESTSKKYRGKKAATYDEIRTKQMRWDQENEVVERMLATLRPAIVLDCPAGTGRYIQACADVGVKEYVGVDVSSEMLDLARKKVTRTVKNKMTVRLETGDARKHDCVDERVDAVLCIRFLDLIDEDAMQAVMREMFRVSHRAIILTIRLGEKYVPKSNTAEHDRKKFLAIVRRNGWRVAEEVPIFNQGWFVMKLERKSR